MLEGALLTLLVAIMTLLAVPRVSPFDLLIVRGGSMEPAIPVGSAVLVDRAARTPTVGAVMTFRDAVSGVVTHRVVAVLDGSFVTKGDANAAADVTQRLSSDAIGTVRFSVPLLGYALYVLQQPIVFFVALVATLTALILGQVRDIRDEVRRIRSRRGVALPADCTEPEPDA